MYIYMLHHKTCKRGLVSAHFAMFSGPFLMEFVGGLSQNMLFRHENVQIKVQLPQNWMIVVSLGKLLITSWEWPVLTGIQGYCWEPGGTRLTLCPRAVGCFPQEYAMVMCRCVDDFAPGFALN